MNAVKKISPLGLTHPEILSIEKCQKLTKMGQNGVIRKVISRQRKVVAQKFDRIRDQRPEIDLKTYAACPNSKK